MGDLLFFTNGVVVGNALGDTMQNGLGLNPSTYTNSWYPEGLLLFQANLIIPDPGHSAEYYLFHNTVHSLQNFTAKYVYVSKVDMTMDGGYGAVTTKNQVIHSGTLQNGHITAVKHGNGRDWWVYAYDYVSNEFLRWIVAPAGISGPFAQQVGVDRTPDAGQVVFSPSGDQFAYFSGLTGLDIFDVDRCNGSFAFAGHVEVPPSQSPNFSLGTAFSPSGRFIYVSAEFDVYQVDAFSSDLQSSLLHIATWDSTYSPGPPFATGFAATLLAPDGKIYLSQGNGTDKLHVINHPDSLGLACDVVQNGITLPTYWKNSLPNHPNYHLGPLVGSPCDTLGLSVAEHAVRLNLSLYPNPNAGSFTLTYAPQPKAGLLEVYDMHRKCVLTAQVAPWSQLKRVELPAMPAGVYLCRLSFGNATATQRVVISAP